MLILAAGLLGFLPSSFNIDSWLGFVTGREIWQSGLPHHEVLTSMSHGITWVDQQWLAQLAMYGIYLLGGLGLVGLVNMVLIVSAVVGAVVGARKLGASPQAVLWVLPVCLWLIIPSHEVRTQEFAMPLFVATAYLLATDSRAPSRCVYWCFPILLLWGNLHGSVTLGAVLVALRGVTVAWERRNLLLHSARHWRRPLVLVLGAALCPLVTPYGVGIIAYYHTMLLGSSVMTNVSEWQPVTSVAKEAVPFFVAAAIALWLFGRNPSRTTLWEKLAVLVLIAAGIDVIRNLLFFGLFALMVMPVALAWGEHSEGKAAAPGRGPINAALAVIAVAAVVFMSAVTLIRPAATIELSFQRTGVLTAVERATRADPPIKVLADVRFADWLLWRDPGLSGRIANDARWELLTPAQMNGLQALFSVVGPNWKQAARGYRLIVLDTKHDPASAQAFSSEPGSRVLYRDGERIVILRSARAAA